LFVEHAVAVDPAAIIVWNWNFVVWENKGHCANFGGLAAIAPALAPRYWSPATRRSALPIASAVTNRSRSSSFAHLPAAACPASSGSTVLPT
jgi:hypothetical protein